jgi:ferritin-like protein
MHPGTQALLRYFEFEHLPEHLQPVSRPFHDVAHDMAGRLPEDPETTVCLRKLLEAKDCAVRAAL